MAKNWIKDAIKKPGALHKELGVKPGQKIPAKKMEKAEKKAEKKAKKTDNTKMERQLSLAKTLKKMHKK